MLEYFLMKRWFFFSNSGRSCHPIRLVHGSIQVLDKQGQIYNREQTHMYIDKNYILQRIRVLAIQTQ